MVIEIIVNETSPILHQVIWPLMALNTRRYRFLIRSFEQIESNYRRSWPLVLRCLSQLHPIVNSLLGTAKNLMSVYFGK